MTAVLCTRLAGWPHLSPSIYYFVFLAKTSEIRSKNERRANSARKIYASRLCRVCMFVCKENKTHANVL